MVLKGELFSNLPLLVHGWLSWLKRTGSSSRWLSLYMDFGKEARCSHFLHHHNKLHKCCSTPCYGCLARCSCRLDYLWQGISPSDQLMLTSWRRFGNFTRIFVALVGNLLEDKLGRSINYFSSNSMNYKLAFFACRVFFFIFELFLPPGRHR